MSETIEEARARHYRRVRQKRSQKSRSSNDGRPGTRLRSEAPELFKSTCSGCNDIANLMDAWGVTQSFGNMDRIVKELSRTAKLAEIESVRNLSDEAIEQAVRQSLNRERAENAQH